MTPKGTRKSAKCKFYLLSPKSNMDADALASELLSIKPVEEVIVTEGDYGFIVKAGACKDKEPTDLMKYMAKRGIACQQAMSHYSYKK